VLTALGGLVLGEEGHTFREHASGLMYAIGAGSIAMFAGSAVSGHGALSFIAIVAISAVAALFGTLSRPLAVAAARFMIFSVIAVNIGTRGVHPITIMCLFSLGAFWTAGLSLGLRVLCSILHVGNKSLSTPVK
jgi:hypothetical protein